MPPIISVGARCWSGSVAEGESMLTWQRPVQVSGVASAARQGIVSGSVRISSQTLGGEPDVLHRRRPFRVHRHRQQALAGRPLGGELDPLAEAGAGAAEVELAVGDPRTRPG